MSMRAYAKHRGVSPEAVSKAVKKGRLTKAVVGEGADRKIDSDVADREWAENSDPTKFRNSGAENRQAAAPEAEPIPEATKKAQSTVVQSAAVLKSYQARLAKLDFEERSGRLVDADKIRKLWTSVAAIARTKVLGIPSKLRQRIEITPEQYAMLELIVREALEELANERAGVEDEQPA
jgi:hypothetical protein